MAATEQFEFAMELNRVVMPISDMVRPFVLSLLATIFVVLLAARQGHSKVVWLIATLPDWIMALCFAAQESGKWKRREEAIIVSGGQRRLCCISRLEIRPLAIAIDNDIIEATIQRWL